MSFVLNKKDISWQSIRASLAMVFFFWLCAILLAVIIIQAIQYQLQAIDKKNVQERLSYFLEETATFTRNKDTSVKMEGPGYLHGLTFVRIQRASEQILFSEESERQLDFQGVASIDARISGAWIDLENPGSQGDWTVVSQVFASGIIVQAGKEMGESLKIYQNIIHNCRVGALLFLPISVLLALLHVKFLN